MDSGQHDERNSKILSDAHRRSSPRAWRDKAPSARRCIAAGLLARGHRVDLVLQRLVCHYPEEVPHRARIFFASGRSDRRTRAMMGRLDNVFQPIASEPLPWRFRYPRIGTLGRLPRRQYPLLLSTRLPRWAASIAHHLDRERPDALLAMNVLAAAAAAMALSISAPPTSDGSDSARALGARTTAPAGPTFLSSDGRCSRSVPGSLGRVREDFRSRSRTNSRDLQPRGFRTSRTEGRRAGHSPVVRQTRFSGGILAIGKLIERKGFPVLLTAFSRLLTERSARLVVLGEGRMKKRLVSLAKALRIADHVDFAGFEENPYAFLANADLFVLSSRNEALPTVLIEAMACGCPVVSTDCPFGPREILEEGKLGPLVPVGDSEALAAAMDPRPGASHSSTSNTQWNDTRASYCAAESDMERATPDSRNSCSRRRSSGRPLRGTPATG